MSRSTRANIVFGLIGILGACLIFIATDPRVLQYSSFLSALGGAILGVGISLFAGRLGGKTDFEELSEVLEKQYAAAGGYERIGSNPEEAARLCGRWYCYTVSPRRSELLWKVARYDVRLEKETGELRFSCDFMDNRGKKIRYDYQAMVRGERLLIVGRNASGLPEPPVLQVFHHGGRMKNKSEFGVTYHRAWSNHDSISPSILSRDPLFGFRTDSTASEEVSAKLDDLWREGYSEQDRLFFPRIMGVDQQLIEESRTEKRSDPFSSVFDEQE